ncbi:MAG: PKD domain-containing protein [Gaiella sp.]
MKHMIGRRRVVLVVAAAVAVVLAAVGAAPAAQIAVQGEIVIDSYTYTGVDFSGQPQERCVVAPYVQFRQVPGATSAVATATHPNWSAGIPFEYPAIGAPPWNTSTRLPGGGQDPIVRTAPDGMSWIVLGGALDAFRAQDCADAVVDHGRWTLQSVTVETSNTPPAAGWRWQPSATDPLTIDLDGSFSSDDKGIVSYEWSFSDGGTASGITTSHTFATAGTYGVTLTVTDAEGLSDPHSADVTVGQGALEIILETRPTGDPTVFAFGGSGPLGSFQLDTNPETALQDRISFDQLDPGKYTVHQDLPESWRVGSLSCTDPTFDSSTRPADASVDVDIAPGEAVTCTFELVPSGSLLVNSTADTPDSDASDGVCFTGERITRGTAQEPECTLRAAIDEANERDGPDTVGFDVPGASIPVIAVSEVLVSKQQITIDGATQPGGGKVELDGGLRDPVAACDAFDSFHDGLILDGSASLVRGLVLHSFPGYALVLGENGGHKVTQTFVGVDAAGTSSLGNGLACSLEDLPGTGYGGGILIGSSANTVGLPGAGNVISGNSMRHPYEGGTHCDTLDHVGVEIAAGAGNVVQSNIIGLDVTGRVFVGPARNTSCSAGTQAGVRVRGGSGARIGGGSVDARNVIVSGDAGVIVESSSTGTSIEGNYIGVDATGVSDPIPPGSISDKAVGIFSEEDGTRIVGNVVSGNESGVQVAGRDANVTGNRVGLAASSDAPVPNGLFGISASGSGALVVGNTIAYTSFGAGRFGHGILVDDGSGNTLSRNVLFGNAGLGIDLATAGGSIGPTPNDSAFDADSGPNGLQNHPLVGGAVVGAESVLSGSLDSAPLASFTIEVFASQACDPSGYGEAGRFVGTFVVTTDVLGTAIFRQPIPGGFRAGEYITATATNSDGSTSELSPCRLATEDILRLISPAPAGSSRLDVSTSAGLVGKVVTIGSGATSETNYGVATGSLILARPIRFAHAAGETVVAVDDTLFVSVDTAVITRFSRLPDLAVLSGRLRPIEGRTIACGDDVTLSLGRTVVAQRVPGTRFVRQAGNRCVFVAKTTNEIGRLELDLGKGTWNAQVIRPALERLTNPLEVGLKIGDDEGSETLRMTHSGSIWSYER